MSKEKVERKPVKIAFFGPANSGKSQIVNRLVRNEYNELSESTIGMSFSAQKTNDGVELEYQDLSGQERYFGMLDLYTKPADICVICIDQSDPDSLKAAHQYAKKIRDDKGADAQIIIAITKTDKPKMDNFDEKITAFREKYSVAPKQIIETSAKTGEGIAKLRHSIEDIIDLKAKKSGEITPDRTFVRAFESVYLGRFKNAQLEDKSTLGLVSRVFDSLVLPMVDIDTFNKEFTKAGNIMAYMRPILNSAAELLLSKDRSRLNDTVIDAIGKEKYAEIVGGTVKEGKVIAIAGNEKEFVKIEAELARQTLAAVAVNYAQSFPILDESPKHHEYREKGKTLSEGFNRITSLIEDNAVYISQTYKVTNTEQLDLEFQSINLEIEEMQIKLAQGQEITKREKQELSLKVGGFRDKVDQFFNAELRKLMGDVIAPLNVMATQFSMSMLDRPTGENLTFQEVKTKVDAFYEMALAAQADILSNLETEYRKANKLGDKDSIPKEASEKMKANQAYVAVTKMLTQLGSAQDVNDVNGLLGSSSDNTKKEFMLLRYKEAANTFVASVDKETLNAQSPTVRGILERLYDAIVNKSFSLLFDTPQERAGIERFEEQQKIKKELISMKNEHTASDDYPESMKLE